MITEKEKIVLRKGNIAIPVGIWRALHASDNLELTREHFEELVMANYMVDELSDILDQEVTKAWEKIKLLLEDFNMLVYYSHKRIKIKKREFIFE